MKNHNCASKPAPAACQPDCVQSSGQDADNFSTLSVIISKISDAHSSAATLSASLNSGLMPVSAEDVSEREFIFDNKPLMNDMLCEDIISRIIRFNKTLFVPSSAFCFLTCSHKLLFSMVSAITVFSRLSRFCVFIGSSLVGVVENTTMDEAGGYGNVPASAAKGGA